MENSLQDQVRVQIYRHFIATGNAPAASEAAAALHRDESEIDASYAELAASRVITFAPGSHAIWMAHPFSAIPTPYRVQSGATSYWANCAWDALGIAAVLGSDTECLCRCPECNQIIDLSVKHGAVAGDGVIHFVVPPRRFWENVAFT